MRALAFLAVLSAFLALPACPPSPGPVPPSPDADAIAPPAPIDASSACASACAKMASLHCSGLTDHCRDVMTRLKSDRLIRAPGGQPVSCACVAAANTAADVAACGIGCQP